MKKNKQTSFWKTPAKMHGGGEEKGKRKGARPIATKRPMLLTLKSSRARGEWNLLKFDSKIEEKMNMLARKFRVRIYRRVNVGNHLHLVVRASSRREFQNFLRVFTQAVMFLVTGARKGRAKGKFWDNLACSRVVEWGRDWRIVKRYILKNEFEKMGANREWLEMFIKHARAAGAG